MKLEALFEDRFTRMALKVQQDLIDHLSDKWEVELKHDGFYFSIPGKTTASVKGAEYSYIDDMGDRSIDQLEAVVRDHVLGLNVTPLSVIGYKTRSGSPKFDIRLKSVNDAVIVLWDMISVDLDSLRNSSQHELEDICRSMDENITA